MTQDSLNSVHEAILEALKIVSDAKRSAETAHAEALNAWRALSEDAIYVPFAIRMRLDATEKDLQLTKSRMSDGINKLESLAASVARLQADAEKPPISDANSEWGPWIEWEGGECPVPAGTQVDVEYRNGDRDSYENAAAWNWERFDGPHTIVAYRVRQPVAPPASSEAKRVELAEALNRAEAAERELEDVRKERDTCISAYTYLAAQAERDHNRVAELSAEIDRLRAEHADLQRNYRARGHLYDALLKSRDAVLDLLVKRAEEIKRLRAERDGVSAALRDGLDPFAVVLATEGPAAYADRWRALATSLWAERLKRCAEGRKDPDIL